MDKIRQDLTAYRDQLLSKGYKPWVCDKTLKQYAEILAYVANVELAIEAGYQMCDGEEYAKFITIWTSCNYRPKWLPESLHSDSESCNHLADCGGWVGDCTQEGRGRAHRPPGTVRLPGCELRGDDGAAEEARDRGGHAE